MPKQGVIDPLQPYDLQEDLDPQRTEAFGTWNMDYGQAPGTRPRKQDYAYSLEITTSTVHSYKTHGRNIACLEDHSFAWSDSNMDSLLTLCHQEKL